MKQELNNSPKLYKSTVAGLRELINTSKQFQYLKKRAKILEKIQSHNEVKIQNYLKSLEKFENVKHDRQQSNETKCYLAAKKKEIEEQLKLQSRKFRQLNKNKLSDIIKEKEIEKISDRRRIREQSFNIVSRIHENRQKQLMDKKLKRDRVLQFRKKSKEKYQTFFIEKREDLQKRTQAELNRIQKRKRYKENQIIQIKNKQNDLLEKGKQLITEFSSVKTRLAEIYGIENKSQKKSSSVHNTIDVEQMRKETKPNAKYYKNQIDFMNNCI